jgi:hypothetical protein
MSGADLTVIDAIGVETVQVVISEYGPDLSPFPTEKHFVSYLTLSPRQAVSGGKAVTKKKKKGTASTRVAAALRMAALSLRHSQSASWAYYRLLRWGQPYIDQGAASWLTNLHPKPNTPDQTGILSQTRSAVRLRSTVRGSGRAFFKGGPPPINASQQPKSC